MVTNNGINHRRLRCRVFLTLSGHLKCTLARPSLQHISYRNRPAARVWAANIRPAPTAAAKSSAGDSRTNCQPANPKSNGPPKDTRAVSAMARNVRTKESVLTEYT